MCVRWLYLCGGCGWLLVRFHCLAVWLVCLVWVCLGLRGLVCVGGRGTGVCIERVSVCTFKTFPCVLAACPHVSYMWAWCRYTRGRFECTHGGVLNVHTVFFFTFFHRAATHKHKHTHTKHTPRPPTTPRPHNTTRRQKQREKENERDKTRQEKRRRDKTRRQDKRREKMK